MSKAEQSGCAASMASLVIVFLSVPLRGWAVAMLWNWFVLPLFPAAPVLTVGPAIGLGMVLALFHTVDVSSREVEDPGALAWRTVGSSVISPLLGVGIGWIVHALVYGA